eukprot:gene11368-12064_t
MLINEAVMKHSKRLVSRHQSSSGIAQMANAESQSEAAPLLQAYTPWHGVTYFNCMIHTEIPQMADAESKVKLPHFLILTPHGTIPQMADADSKIPQMADAESQGEAAPLLVAKTSTTSLSSH